MHGGSLFDRTQRSELPPLLMGQIHKWLKKHGVICSLRSGALRVSPHLYNSDVEVTKFCALLGDAVDAAMATGNSIGRIQVQSRL